MGISMIMIKLKVKDGIDARPSSELVRSQPFLAKFAHGLKIMEEDRADEFIIEIRKLIVMIMQTAKVSAWPSA